jgi:hypothetical protein
MLKTNILAALLLFLHGIPADGWSQTVIIKESQEKKTFYLHEFFRPAPGTYVTIHNGAPHSLYDVYYNSNKQTVITGYDAGMNQIYTNPLPELFKKQYLGTIQVNKQLHLFYAEKEQVYAYTVDGITGKEKGKHTPLFKATTIPHGFIKGYSPDSTLCFGVAKVPASGHDQLFDGVVMDTSLKVVTRFTFAIGDIRHATISTTCILTPEGILYVINCVNTKPGKAYRPLTYLVTEINKEGKTTTTLLEDLPDGRLANMIWTHSPNGLSFTGLLAKEKKEDFTVLLSGEFNGESKKVTGMKEVTLSDVAYWQQVPAGYLPKIRKGIPQTASMINHFKLVDGSIYLIVQPFESLDLSTPSRLDARTTTGNIYLFRIKPDRDLEWIQVIPMDQTELTLPQFTGALATLYKGKDLLVFFHEYKDNSGPLPAEKTSRVILSNSKPPLQLTAFHVKENGSLNRVLRAAHPIGINHLLSPNAPFAAFDGELLYGSYHYASNVFGNHTHKPTRIVITD